jgi:hypothetical protein
LFVAQEAKMLAHNHKTWHALFSKGQSRSLVDRRGYLWLGIVGGPGYPQHQPALGRGRSLFATSSWLTTIASLSCGDVS